MARKELSVEPREVTGKKVAQLRRAGMMPGNIYGRGLDSVSIQVRTDDLEHTVRASTANEVIDIKVEGERAPRPVVIHKIQRNPLNSRYLHADFYQVSLREKMRADVPLVVIGSSVAIDTYNGVLVHATEILHIEALPLDIPTHIEVDISTLTELEATIHVRDLPIPANVTVLSDPDIAVVKIASPRVSAEEEMEPVAAAAGAPAAAEREEESSSDGESASEN
ncbi:MAG TPA: 50S ribosomal protein L25 [Dehalococcoidia bacterium]|nr:50S ribosomal protein L25 [Dehalococcoidia bacterium]